MDLYWTEKYNITLSEFKFLSLTELRWLSCFVSSTFTHLFAEFSSTDREQSFHDVSVCLWRVTGPNMILYSAVRNLDPDGIWFQTSSLKGHGVFWSLLLRNSTAVQSCRSKFSQICFLCSGLIHSERDSKHSIDEIAKIHCRITSTCSLELETVQLLAQVKYIVWRESSRD